MADKLESRELRIISDFPSRNKPGSGHKMRVIHYAKEEGRPGSKSWKSLAVKLESGEYWKGDDGITRFKAKGLSARDLEALLAVEPGSNLRVIQSVLALMKNPPAFVPPAPAPSSPSASENPDKCPF
jgi:hypothetical protein